MLCTLLDFAVVMQYSQYLSLDRFFLRDWLLNIENTSAWNLANMKINQD